MKIKKIKLQNNPFFGNVEFDFTDAKGNIMDNIVFAGENGCGKTQLLNIIYEFSTIPTGGTVSRELRIFTVVLSNDEIKQISQNIGSEYALVSPTGEMEITLDFTQQPNYWSRINVTYLSVTDDGTLQTKKINSSHFFATTNVKRLFRSVYSTVEINYNPKEAENVTSQEVDAQVESSMRSGTNLATQIQQLLIDLDTNDALDLKKMG
jgi:ABC-type cobalamin/Fe3+-siderophores transport system ATPase subunit